MIKAVNNDAKTISFVVIRIISPHKLLSNMRIGFRGIIEL